MTDEEKTTTWGDCGDNQCLQYGRMKYGIEPGDECASCFLPLRWWDRWHDGKHRGDRGIGPCEQERRAA